MGNATGLNAEGSNNTYVGLSAGWSGSTASTGSCNTFMGEYAGAHTTSGNENSAFGYLAGIYNTTGSFNLDLANPGVAGESNTIRIGNQGPRLKTFIAGIVNNTTTNPANVYISPSGQLEVGTSSSGGIGPCSSGSGYFALWTGTTAIGCPDTYLTLSGTNLNMVGNITASLKVTGATINATGDFLANGTPGISGTADTTTGTCVLTFQEGLLVAMYGC